MILNAKPQVKDLGSDFGTSKGGSVGCCPASQPTSCWMWGGLTWGSGGLNNNGKQNGSYHIMLGLEFRVRGT